MAWMDKDSRSEKIQLGPSSRVSPPLYHHLLPLYHYSSTNYHHCHYVLALRESDVACVGHVKEQSYRDEDGPGGGDTRLLCTRDPGGTYHAAATPARRRNHTAHCRDKLVRTLS